MSWENTWASAERLPERQKMLGTSSACVIPPALASMNVESCRRGKHTTFYEIMKGLSQNIKQNFLHCTVVDTRGFIFHLFHSTCSFVIIRATSCQAVANSADILHSTSGKCCDAEIPSSTVAFISPLTSLQTTLVAPVWIWLVALLGDTVMLIKGHDINLSYLPVQEPAVKGGTRTNIEENSQQDNDQSADKC